jgi:hypothetical protein
LAFRLREYGIRSKSLSVGGEYGPRPKGYTRVDLHDAWERYLPPPPSSPDRSATAATGATERDFRGPAVADVADSGSAVADDEEPESADKTDTVAAVADVADVAGDRGRATNGGTVLSDIEAVYEELAAQDERYCMQCNGSEGPLWEVMAADGPAQLHRECRRFWFKAHPQPKGRTIGSVLVREIAAPAISAGPDDCVYDLDPSWRWRR